jgi:hypothetical protein
MFNDMIVRRVKLVPAGVNLAGLHTTIGSCA